MAGPTSASQLAGMSRTDTEKTVNITEWKSGQFGRTGTGSPMCVRNSCHC